MDYNYKKEMYDAVLESVTEWLDVNPEALEGVNGDYVGLYEDLYDILWFDDSVTGNGSVSYTFDEHYASECLVGNYSLLKEALNDYCQFPLTDISAQVFDVTIRCYLLPDVLYEVLSDLNDETKNWDRE